MTNIYSLVGNRILTAIIMLSSFSLSAQTITHPATGTSSTTITCGTSYTYYDPGGTGNYGNNQLGTLTINPSVGGQYVSIDFSTGPFDVEPNGGGCYDFLRIYDGTSTAASLLGTYCNSNVPGLITSTTGSLTILFDTDGSAIRSGWQATATCSATPGPVVHPSSGTSSMTVPCGSTLTYYDPGGTGNYGNNNLGTMTFNPSVVGQMVRIDFTAGAFDIEPNGGGCYDWIRVYDGTTTGAPLMGTYCNSNVPGVITSTTGSLTVVFDSDGFTTGSGWVANITCFSPCAVAGGTSSASPGSFCPSGNATLSLAGEDPAATIQWQVSTDGGATWTNIAGATTDPWVQNVTVNSSFRAQVTNGCTSNSTTSAVTVGCPTITHPSSGTSSTTITCGIPTTYYDPGGSAGNYSNFQLATYTINPSVVGQMVQIDFTTGAFDIEPNGGGCYDWISIYDGTSTAAPLIGTYCNSNLPGIITSTTGSLTIVFDSDSGTTGTGWDAEVTCFTPCATAGGTSSASPNSFCPTGNATLSLIGEDPAASIQWQVSTDAGVTWTNIAGATTDPWVQNVTVNSVFRAQLTNGCTSNSTTSAVSVGCPPIIQPTSGSLAATASCGATVNFYDSGNIGSNYGNSENGLVTICPSVAGQYAEVNFTAFSTESNFDYLYVFDGDNGGAQLIGIYDGTSSPGTITASTGNASGCLSFRFNSDGGSTSSGWSADVTCVAVGAAPYPAAGVEDCNGAIAICSNSSLVGGTTGPGLDELPNLWNSCIDAGETQSNWYVFSPTTGGTIGFEIIPNSPTDYDWAIWGPYTYLQCPAFTNDVPIRCSSSQLIGNGNTGLVAPATDVIEQNGEYGGGANENGFLAPMNVNAGEIYVMMLDNWSGSNVGFQLDWNLTNGASLDCTPLPVELLNYKVNCDQNHTKLTWSTSTETNNDYFVIEKADDEFNFTEVGRIQGAGNSTTQLEYSFVDPKINVKTAYYRLSQVDYDGETKKYRVVASNCQSADFKVIQSTLVENSLDLVVSANMNEALTVHLHSSTGQLIGSKSFVVNTGNNKMSMNNLNLGSGVYIMSIHGTGKLYTKKLMLTR